MKKKMLRLLGFTLVMLCLMPQPKAYAFALPHEGDGNWQRTNNHSYYICYQRLYYHGTAGDRYYIRCGRRGWIHPDKQQRVHPITACKRHGYKYHVLFANRDGARIWDFNHCGRWMYRNWIQ